MTDPTPATLSIDKLLLTGVAAARAGNRSAARELFLAITRAYPHEVRAWLGLASVAANAQEQRKALEQVVALDPSHLKARQALALLPPPPPAEPPIPAPVEDVAPHAPAPMAEAAEAPLSPAYDDGGPTADDLPAKRRFPLLTILALGIIGLLIIAIIALLNGNIPGINQRAAAPAALPSPVLQVAAATALASPEPFASSTSPTSTTTAPPALGQGAVPTVGPTSTVGLVAQPSLPLGTLVEVDGWSTTLLRPDYALILDGTIGDLRPTGRFVLALMAVSNNSAEQRRIPIDLFTLVDNRGRHYRPTPNASTAYLALYERGQHGDLALEDSLAPHSGMRSVPILFDVPADAAGLTLTIRGSGDVGWPIEIGTTPSVNVGP